MTTKRARKAASTQQGLLVNFARAVGFTLGAVAARTEGLPKSARRSTASKKIRSKASRARKKIKV